MLRPPIVPVTIMIACDVIIVIHVITVVGMNVWASIPPVVPVRMSVVRMTIIAVVINVQPVRVPADGKSRRNTPEEAMVECISGRIRVVVNRVRPGVVVINRTWLIHDDTLGFIVRNVNYVLLDWRDLNYAVFLRNGLVLVALQVSSCVGAVTESFDRSDNCGLLSDHGFTKTPGPVKVVSHHLDDFRIVAQRND